MYCKSNVTMQGWAQVLNLPSLYITCHNVSLLVVTQEIHVESEASLVSGGKEEQEWKRGLWCFLVSLYLPFAVFLCLA